MTPTVQQAAGVLAALLAVTACGDDAPVRRAEPVPSAQPAPGTASPLPVPPGEGVLLAVVRGDGGLELHRVDPQTRVAQLERELEPPAAGAVVGDVTLAGGQDPRVCASWYRDPETRRESSLLCYEPGTRRGTAVRGVDEVDQVALSTDGRRLAWSGVPDGENQELSTARLVDGRLVDVRTVLGRADQPATGGRAFTGTGVQDLAWVEETELAVSTSVESDDGPLLLRVDLMRDTGGWQQGRPVPEPDPDYLVYDSVISVEDGTALAVQRGSYIQDDDPPPSRAVRIDLGTGEVLERVATAAEGREVVGVSGTRAGVVYVTAGDETAPLVVYLRRPGEARGTPITGLPKGAQVAQAQSQPLSDRSG